MGSIHAFLLVVNTSHWDSKLIAPLLLRRGRRVTTKTAKKKQVGKCCMAKHYFLSIRVTRSWQWGFGIPVPSPTRSALFHGGFLLDRGIILIESANSCRSMALSRLECHMIIALSLMSRIMWRDGGPGQKSSHEGKIIEATDCYYC